MLSAEHLHTKEIRKIDMSLKLFMLICKSTRATAPLCLSKRKKLESDVGQVKSDVITSARVTGTFLTLRSFLFHVEYGTDNRQ